MERLLNILRDYVIKNSTEVDGVLLLPKCWYYQDIALGLCAIVSNLNTEKLITYQEYKRLAVYVKAGLEIDGEAYKYIKRHAQPRLDWLDDQIASYSLECVS